MSLSPRNRWLTSLSWSLTLGPLNYVFGIRTFGYDFVGWDGFGIGLRLVKLGYLREEPAFFNVASNGF